MNFFLSEIIKYFVNISKYIMNKCINLAKKYNIDIKDNKKLKRWILVNHPDKTDHPQHDNNVTTDDYNKIVECYKEDFFKKAQKENNKTIKVTKANRKKIFTCMRQRENFSKISNYHKFDKAVFNGEQLNLDLNDASPKILQLLNNIKKLDEIDKKNHGKCFKHFIFSDVKEGGYGAKIIASAFISNGYHNVIKAKKVDGVKKLKLYIQTSNDKENFGLLCSNSIFGSTFNEKLKKELLKLFNSRPDNIYGEKLRFIIFDSGFKEGIDLFDVKYVHIFEPSMTIADLKQTVGRATRTCGQKGLPFQDGIGWPLYVYNYYLTVPSLMADTLTSSKFLNQNITETKENEKDEEILIFKNIEKLNDATMKYSEFDEAMINLSKQLFELGPKLSVDYNLTENLHNVEDLNSEYMEQDFYLMGGKKKDLFKKINKKSKYFKIDFINCKGKCGKRTNNDIPVSSEFLKRVYKKYNHPNKFIPKINQRNYFCSYLRSVPMFCEQVNHEWSLRYSYVPESVEKDYDLDDLELESGTEESIDADYKDLDYDGKNDKNLHGLKINDNIPKTKMSFVAMRNFIKTHYNNKNFKWDKLVIENKCVPKPGEKPKAAHEIDLNPTQNFISTYFCPESPYKGMLLWHSVGTGKTCTGVATASASFEQRGYTILWVTRTTLKSDVWKNIFDQICHINLKKEVELGLTIPEKLTERKKLMSDRWLEPMSYKQFSNLLLGKNKIYDILKERNGTEDVLNKTLIIIDEAHKLYGGDLKASERPDTNIMEKLIMNSYKKSGPKSCKLLIMTATPFTNSPLELFNLTNLFFTNENEKITTDKDDFKKQYMTSKNILSQNGVKNLANKLSGYISYLNREKDATQFAQPIMINIPILTTHIKELDLREAIYLKKEINKMDNEAKEIINDLKNKIKKLKEEYKEKKDIYKEFKSSGKVACKEQHPNDKEARNQCIEEFKEEVNSLNDDLKEIMTKIKELQEQINRVNANNAPQGEIKNMKDRLKQIKKSLLQEYIMYVKCGHLKYKDLSNKSSVKSIKNLKYNSSSSSVPSNASQSYNPSINITKTAKKSKKKTKKSTNTKKQYDSYSN